MALFDDLISDNEGAAQQQPAPQPLAPQEAIRQSAQRLQVSPEDWATVIAYETGGTFDPWQKGPTTKWGEHRGLIQWGEPQRQQYGVTPDMSFAEQIEAAERYLLDRGFRPGEMGLADLYSTINAGSPGRMGASDRPGFNVARHVQEMNAHRPKARAFLGGEGGQLSGGGLFDDLIADQTASGTTGPVPQQGSLFDDLVEDTGGPAAPRLEPGMGEPVPGAPVGEVGGGGPASPAVDGDPDQPGLFDSVAPNFLRNSMLQMQTRNTMLRVLAGEMDFPTASQRFAELVKERESIPENESYVAGVKSWARKNQGLAPEYEGFTGALRFAKDHPLFVAEAVGESSLQTLEGIGTGLVGSVVGAPAGPLGMATGFGVGLGASSGVTEGMAKFIEVLQEEGIDITNEESLAGAFANEELLATAKEKAQAKGLTVAAFDGLTSFIGIRGGGRVLAEGIDSTLRKVTGAQTVAKTKTRQVIEEGAASLFLLEGPGGMGGEYFGELAAGDEPDNIEVMMEGFGEIMLGSPQVAIQIAMPGGERTAQPATERQIKDVFSAITGVPSYEEAEAQGRNWFGFVQTPFPQNQAVPGQASVNSRVTKDYTAAEELMGQNDPRSGKLVAVMEDDVTAIAADARRQATDGTATLRFTQPEREPDARAKWESFVDTKLDEDYRAAVELGLRVAPTVATAEFVGDVTASEILPKSELPMRDDQYELHVHSPSQGMLNISSPYALNTKSLLEDDRFTVVPKNLALTRLKRNERAETMAAALFEVNDPQLQETLTNEGWSGLLDHLIKLDSDALTQVFETKQMKMRPTLAWNNRMGYGTPLLEVRTQMDAPSAKAALETTHRAIIPRSFAEGGPAVPIEDQDPHISSPTPAQWDIVPLNPRKPGSVDMYVGASVSDNYAKTMHAWQSVAERVMRNLGIKHNLIVIAANPQDILDVGLKFSGGNWKDFAAATGHPGFAGFMIQLANGDVALYVPETAILSSPRDINHYWSVAMHEFGHALSYWKMTDLPVKTQGQIFAAYRRYMLTYRSGTVGSDKRRHQRTRGAMPDKGWTGNEADPYYLTFEEWFAEQTARWGTSSAKPVGRAARFFRALGRILIDTFRKFQNELGDKSLQFKAEPVIQEWLDATYDGVASPWGSTIQQSFIERTRAANARHGVDTALQAESIKTHAVLDEFLNANNVPPNTAPANAASHTPAAQKAQTDRFNWLMKWGIGFKQLAQENPHIRPLQLYAELMKMSRLEVNNIMAEAEAILKEMVRPLRRVKTAGRTQADRLADFLFDMTEMTYRSQDEVNKGIRRNPTQEEFQRLAKKHQLNQEALAAYAALRDFFAKVVLRGEEVAIAEAQHTFANNPEQLRIAITSAKMMTQKMLSAPYFPMTRFGQWAVSVRTARGGIERFETYETKKEQQRALAEAERLYPKADGWSVTVSTLPEEAQSFAGMPPWFIDKLKNMPGTTPEQQEWLQLLRYQVSPARSFRKHLLPRKRVAGYSRDLERVFARYSFQHARHYGRIKYQRHMEAQIKALRGEAFQYEAGTHDANRRTRMADYLQDHYESIMNPGPDWHFLRSATSVWYLGFMVSSAVLNMSQTVLIGLPQLGSRFGDVRASAALMKASADLTNYYKRGSYEGMTEGHFKMLDFLIKRGDVTESMAAELAGLAAGNSLDSYMGFSDGAHRAWLAFADKAMLLFKLVEQWNRRVIARSSYELAMKDINHPAVQDVKNEFFLQYQKMTEEGFGSDSEILATLFAGKMIDSVHYDYSKEARPRFMRGRKGLLFAFYMFTQNTVFQLAHRHNRGVFTRYALIMLFLAGPMGLMPDEAEDTLNFVARRFFGKQFDLRMEARKLVNDLTGNPKWTDGILHGAGRHGFGIPALLESIGGPDVPEVDFSRLVELRNIAPLPISRGLDMVDRGINAEKTMSRFVLDTAGAGFGLPYQWMMAALDDELELTDIKRWERGMPRALKKVSEAARRGYEGGERVGQNNYIMEYDRNNPTDMAELAAHAMGFTSTRSAVSWDLSAAQREQAMFWKGQRQALLNAAFQAKFYYKDPESWKRAREDIVEFNKTVPDPTLRITGDAIRRSFQTRRRRQHEFLHGDGPNMPPIISRDVKQEFPEVRRVGEQKLRRGGLGFRD